MRFTSLTTSLLLILLPLLASASRAPPCILQCSHSALESSTCGDKTEIAKRIGEHTGCLCKDKGYKDALDLCIANSGKCNGDEEVKAAREAVATYCKGKN
ncbi:hypothetical protein HOY80DRAFT_942741 [Tuber brumale]|nr:hypothetical protein HOY80DRAFT_942741 [Tuber brumale]